MATSFETIIDRFLGKITDDMYLELTYEDTIRDAKQFLLDAIPYFEFPRFQLYNYDEELEQYNVDLTTEEIHILALLMKTAWLERQINSIEHTRMKYSGSDFKMTSQANHLSKLLQLKSENVRESTHAQRLYKRRRNTSDGRIESNWSVLGKSTFDADTTTTTTTTKPSTGNGCDCDTPDWEPILGNPSSDSNWSPIAGPQNPNTGDCDCGETWGWEEIGK